MSPLWVALLAACRWSVDPDDPVKDPDILPDTATVDSDTHPTDSDPPDTDPQDTDLTGETATPLPPVLCRPSGKIRAVEDLDRVIQTGSQADMLVPSLRSPMVRAPGIPVVSSFIRETWDVTSGFGRDWVDVDLEALFTLGIEQATVSTRIIDPSIGSIFQSYEVNVDSDSDLEIAYEYNNISSFGMKTSVSSIESNDYNIVNNPYYSSNCSQYAYAKMLYTGYLNIDTTIDFATIHTEVRCASLDGATPFIMQPSPYIVGGYTENSRPFDVNIRTIENAFNSISYGKAYNLHDMNSDGIEDIIYSTEDGDILIKYGPHDPIESMIDSFDLKISGSNDTKLNSSFIISNDATGDLIPDIYAWSLYGGQHGLGSLSLLRGPIGVGTVAYADLIVSEWSMIDPHLRETPHFDPSVESAGDLNADGIDDVIVHLGSFPIWKRGMLSDTSSETGDSSDTSLSYIDTDPATGRDFPYGLSLIIPGGVYGPRDMDEGALRIVRTDRPLPVGDVNGDGHDDIFFGTPRRSGVPPKYGLLYGCDFPLP